MKIDTKKLAEKINAGEVTGEFLEELLYQAQHLTIQATLQMLPEVVRNLIQQTGYMNQLSKDFYEKHKDLAENKEFFAKILEKTEQENPGLPYEKLLEKAAPEARRRLGEVKRIKRSPELSLKQMDSTVGKL